MSAPRLHGPKNVDRRYHAKHPGNAAAFAEMEGFLIVSSIGPGPEYATSAVQGIALKQDVPAELLRKDCLTFGETLRRRFV
jgi:hypothetical protein